MGSYKLAVCDDSDADVRYVSALAAQWAQDEQLQVQVDTFPSAEAFMFHDVERKDYDILLLDIMMGKMDGLALARAIRSENESIQIVFITGYPDYMADGYEVSALHYLVKPVSREKLSAVLNRAISRLRKTEKSVIFMVQGEAVRVQVSDIRCVEAFAHECVITTARAALHVKAGISEVEKLLGDGCVRCHRSYLVGIKHIRSISKTDITLDSGVQIPLSRAHYQAVNQAFIRYFTGA